MTPQQRQTLLTVTRRFGLSASFVVAATSWGFKQYDATNASSTEFRAYRDSVAFRRSIDSVQAVNQFRYLSQSIARTDSAVRKVCAAVNAGC